MSEVNRNMALSSTEEEIDLVEIFYLLWRKLLNIILCFFLGAGIAFAYSYFLITPTYRASSKMYILSASKNTVVNLSDLQIGTALKADYKALLTSRELLEDVIYKLNLDYSYSHLESMITVTNPTDTRILVMTVTSTDSVEAANIANMLASQGQKWLPEVMKTDEPTVYEKAVVPTKKYQPSYSKNTLIGGMLLALLYSVFIVVRYLMDDTLKTSDDVFRYLDLTPLAVVPEGDLNPKKKKSRKTGKSKEE